ncbi:MAG: hypothetical protein NT151_02660 [Acidobacteria bacterium]|nr:hypothetical protein [Acidobacteriota bacterium]
MTARTLTYNRNPMRISCDLDGVVADMDGALAALAEDEFANSAKGRKQKQEDGNKAENRIQKAIDKNQTDGSGGGESSELPGAAVLSRLTARQQARLWHRVRETRNFWESLKEHEPGIVRRIQHLAYQHQWDVLFVTQRPATAGRTAQVQSQRWLHRQGFDLPAVYTTQGSRGRIAAALTLDAHIDDRLENCVDVASESKAWPILVWREEESYAQISKGAHKLGIAVVRTVAEALTLLEAGHA